MPGINMITGHSNSGKTAVFRALDTLITNNQKAKRAIRKGSKEAAVVIVIEGYPQVAWIKSKTETVYKIGNEVYRKLGKNDVFHVYKEFPIFKDYTNEVVQIQGESDPLFPFKKTPSEMFKLFEHMFQASSSNKVLTQIRTDLSGYRSIRNQNEFRIKEYEAGIKTIREDLDKIALTEAEEHIKTATGLETAKTGITADLDNVKEILSIIDLSTGVKEYKPVNGDLLSKSEEILKDSAIVEAHKTITKEEPPSIYTGKEVVVSDYKRISEDKVKLDSIIEELKDGMMKHQEEKDLLKLVTEELGKFKVCPLCNKPRSKHE